ncbi:MAG TPA: hypothetical protein VHO06_10220 [Polyangia bacterium]|nr:hypothetical protein [Polyangia bacterium]
MKTPRLPLALVLVPLALGCLASDPPAVPLYPNAAAAPLPPNQVADVMGPIGKIDGRDVSAQGGRFALLPGCHVVELDRQSDNSSYSLTGGIYLTGSHAAVTYALRMRAGGRYFIRRDTIAQGIGNSVRVVLSAREEMPGGTVTDLEPAKKLADITACKAWETTTLPR